MGKIQPMWINLKDKQVLLSKELFIKTTEWNGMTVTSCKVDGPLCCLYIILPTNSWDNSGLAHTLEHLIFCGSKNYKDKGYLDNLANLAISNGTNAYTSEDHTCYTASTASFNGLCKIIPVYLDHILNPTLTKEHFATEVFSQKVESNGEEKSGVVYMEMKARYKTEYDLLDRRLRELLFRKKDENDISHLAYECGGLPKSIEKLNIERIKEYHYNYYHHSKISIILTGPIDHDKVIDCLKKYFDENQPEIWNLKQELLNTKLTNDYIETKNFNKYSLISKIQEFISNDISLGSVGIGLEGPILSNREDLVSLGILSRFFAESSTSVLYQKFVECNPPLCNTVDFDIKPYYKSGIYIILSGIKAANSKDSLLQIGKISKMLINIFTETTEKLFNGDNQSLETLTNAILRHRDKLIEAIEEESHDTIYALLLKDIIILRNQNNEIDSQLSIGNSLEMLPIIDKISQNDISYWINLIKKYFIDSLWNEVVMIPVIDEDDEDDEDEDELEPEISYQHVQLVNRRKIFDEKTFNELKKLSDTDFIDTVEFPLEWTLYYKNKLQIQEMDRLKYSPFSCIQISKTSTNYHNLTLIFDLSLLPEELYHYLPLFQELLLQSNVNFDNEIKSYQYVVDKLNNMFLSYDVSVGLENSTFSCSYLSNTFVVSAMVLPEKYPEAIKFLIHIIFNAIFELDRILIMSKNLLSNCIDSLRNGTDVIDAMMIDTIGKNSNNLTCKIEHKIGIIEQKPFLESLINSIESSDTNKRNLHLENLNSIRSIILENPNNEFSFLQFGCNIENQNALDYTNVLLMHWCEQVINKSMIRYQLNIKVSEKVIQSNIKDIYNYDPSFNIPKFLQPPNLKDFKSNIAIICGVGGITTTHYTQSIYLNTSDVFNNSETYHAVVLLCTLLSRTEGPLYEAIRGSGLAYDVSVGLSLWDKALDLSFYDTGDPIKCILQVRKLFESLESDLLNDHNQMENILSIYNLTTSRAAHLYQVSVSRSTPINNISYSRKALFRGFKDFSEIKQFESGVYKTSKNSIREVFYKYFKPILDPQHNNISIVCQPSKVSYYIQKFADISINLKEYKLSVINSS